MKPTEIPLERGKHVKLSLPRRFVCDLLYFSQRHPCIPMQRRMNLSEVIAARGSWEQRASWCAIFVKAYSIVAARRPALRRSYISFPYPRLYEHPSNVASFSLEREYEGENGVFFARIHQPEKLSLSELSSLVREHKEKPIESIPSFRSSLLLSRFPRFVRRFVWWLGLDTDGPARAKHFGTFGISVVASIGAASLFIYSPLTTTINYGVFDADGHLDVRVTYDHRVMDGGEMARAMVDLEHVLQNEIREELLAGPQPFKASIPATLLEAPSLTPARTVEAPVREVAISAI